MPVAEQLDLNVARRGDEPFEVEGAIAKSGERLAASSGQRRLELCAVGDLPHSSPAATGRRLDHCGKADPCQVARRHRSTLVDHQRYEQARHDRHAGGGD